MSDSQNADIWINWWSQQDAFISLFIIYYIIIIYYSTLASLENVGALKNAFFRAKTSKDSRCLNLTSTSITDFRVNKNVSPIVTTITCYYLKWVNWLCNSLRAVCVAIVRYCTRRNTNVFLSIALFQILLYLFPTAVVHKLHLVTIMQHMRY